MLRPEIESLLIKQAHEHYQGAALSNELDRRLDAAFPSALQPREARAPPTIPGPGGARRLVHESLWASR